MQQAKVLFDGVELYLHVGHYFALLLPHDHQVVVHVLSRHLQFANWLFQHLFADLQHVISDLLLRILNILG